MHVYCQVQGTDLHISKIDNIYFPDAKLAKYPSKIIQGSTKQNLKNTKNNKKIYKLSACNQNWHALWPTVVTKDVEMISTFWDMVTMVTRKVVCVSGLHTHTCYHWNESEVLEIVCCSLRRSCRCGSVCSDKPDQAVSCSGHRML